VFDPARVTATQLLAALESGELGARALVQALVDRIEALDPALNAVVARRFEAALAEADAADGLRRSGRPVPPLLGLPVTIKDSLEVAGLPATCGSPQLRDYRPAADAPVVRRLREAGAIVLGKTNVPLYASDFQTFNELHGITRNPWALDRTPGGSSGGAAAALAAGFAAAELGSDLAGSLRLPAHFCGVLALKPTWGLLPQGGSLLGPRPVLRERDLAVVGPMARGADDLALLLEVLTAPERAAGQDGLLPAPAAVTTLRVAAWLDEPFCPLDPSLRAVLERALGRLADAGLRIQTDRPAGLDAAAFFESHCALMYGEMSGELPDEVFAFQQRRARQRRHPAGDRLARGLAQSHRDWLAAREAQALARRKMAEFFSGHDLLLCPVAPTCAPPHDARRLEQREQPAAGQLLPVLQHMFWLMLASTTGLPAVVVPVGTDDAGLPVGLQVIAPPRAERRALALAAFIERELGGFRPPPAGPQGFRPAAGGDDS
jgi:amidase